MKEDKYIFHELKSTFSSSGESSELKIIIDVDNEDVSVRLEKSYSKTYKLSELEDAKRDYEKLNGSGYIIDIDRLLKMRHTKPIKESK